MREVWFKSQLLHLTDIKKTSGTFSSVDLFRSFGVSFPPAPVPLILEPYLEPYDDLDISSDSARLPFWNSRLLTKQRLVD
jgi:hypothetical protein